MPTQDDLSMECDVNPKLAKTWNMRKGKHKALNKTSLKTSSSTLCLRKTLMSNFSFLELFISSQ
jgi:hypothetical protein